MFQNFQADRRDHCQPESSGRHTGWLKPRDGASFDVLALRTVPTRMARWFIAMFVLIGITIAGRAEDEIELLSGTRILGKIIEQSEQSIKIEIKAENRQLIRSYPINRIRAITKDGQRRVVGSQSPDPAKPTATPKAEPGGAGKNAEPELLERSPTAVDALIEQRGRTPPDWFESTPLDYPQTLDLSWPEPTPPGWNYTRNVEHYLWDIINTNPKRYASGVRLMHHLLIVNQASESTRARVMNELGRMYFEFFRDFARAAFWWRQAKVEQSPKFSESPSPAHLAECYWRLGSRTKATELLERLPLTPAVIKAWGDLKETEKALALCQEGLKRGFLPSQTHLLAGDACRAVRDFSKSTEFYRKVLEVPLQGTRAQLEQIKRDHDRARATIEVIRLFDTLDLSRIADGTYQGMSLGYSGNLEVEVAVKAGRIDSLKVTHLSDRQYFHAVDETIRRILAKQTVNGVDAISGATITSEAMIHASAKALAEAMRTNTIAK